MEVLDVAREIKKFCENSGGKYGFYRDYSGRMMFGRECVGVVCKDAVQAAADLAGYLSGLGLSLGRTCRDEMGGVKSSISLTLRGKARHSPKGL